MYLMYRCLSTIFVLTLIFAACNQETDEQLIGIMQNSLISECGRLQEPALKAISRLLGRSNKAVSRDSVLNCLVVSGASCLDAEASWIDTSRARQIYDILKNIGDSLVVETLGRQIMDQEIRLRVLYLGAKLGIIGTETKLNAILLHHGDKQMAEDFLNSGSAQLYEGGKQWGDANGYNIVTGAGSHRIRWGSF